MIGPRGIPQGWSPDRLRREFEEFKREVRQHLAAPSYVAIERIVEGGALAPRVGTAITETVQKDIVVEGSNLAPDALNNKALVGSSVTALGSYMAGDAENPGNAYNPYRKVKTRAVLDSRPDPYDPGLGDTQLPGVYLEAEDAVIGSPFQSARLVTSGAAAELRSSQQAKYGPSSKVSVGYTGLLRADGEPNPANKLPGTYSQVQVGANTFVLQSAGQPGIVGTNTAAVRHDGDGVLRMEAPNGVLVNGAPIGSGGSGGDDSGWLTAVYQNGWMDYGNGFGGLQYRRLNGVLFIRGNIKGGSPVSIVTRLPEGFRPGVPKGTTAMEFTISAVQNGVRYAGGMYAYANGDIAYSASPTAPWAGSDRVTINQAFPLS